jgi:ethanolamine-phosphate cytidylyltransferase
MQLQDNRIWIDGCFDFFHHGHANAILQARSYGDELYIGVHSDEEILKNKGPTVMTLKERAAEIEANKWTTKVILNAPYVTQPEWMDRYGCKYVIHGDDITTDADGNDCYGIVREQGRLKLVKRTEGVSTTDLINRLLNPSKVDHYIKDTTCMISENKELIKRFATDQSGKVAYTDVFYSNLSILQKVEGKHYKNYIYGSFDLFNPFHIEVLKHLKSQGDVLVGIYQDGVEHTAMDLLQRTLCVLQCQYVDGVVVGVQDKKAPWGLPSLCVKDFDNEYSHLNNGGIQKRIQDHYDLYVERQKKKGVKSDLESEMEKEHS